MLPSTITYRSERTGTMRTTTLEPVRRLEAAGFFAAVFRRCVGLRAAVLRTGLRTVLRAGLRAVLRTVLRAAGLRVLRAAVLRAGRFVVLRAGFFVALVLRVRVFLVFFFAVAINCLLCAFSKLAWTFRWPQRTRLDLCFRPNTLTVYVFSNNYPVWTTTEHFSWCSCL